MKITYLPTHNVKIFIGSCEQYNGREFDEKDLVEVIGSFQSNHTSEFGDTVRITKTKYVWQDYVEDGFAIEIIHYPRNNKPTKVIDAFMFNLAKYLLVVFKQNRVSIEFLDETILLESDTAQEKHK